jgi:hypothetical protein
MNDVSVVGVADVSGVVVPGETEEGDGNGKGLLDSLH